MISAPHIRSSCVRSSEVFSGITHTSRYPRCLATMARAIPVLPLVGSSKVAPGCSKPSFSALVIIAKAARSFTDPVGLRSSSLAHRRTSGLGDNAGSPTSGVWPTESSKESKRMSAAGHRRQDRDRIPVGHLGTKTIEKADVFVIEVDVHEPTQAGLIDETVGDPRVAGVKVRHQLLQRSALRGDDFLASGVRAQDGGDAYFHGHGRPFSCCDSRVGRTWARHHRGDSTCKPFAASYSPSASTPPSMTTSSSVTSPSTMWNERSSTGPSSLPVWRVETSR